MNKTSAAGILGLCLLSGAVHADEGDCDNPRAEIDAVSGRVEVQRARERVWVRLQLGDRLCIGDALRSDLGASALILLPDGTKERLGEDSHLTIGEPRDADGNLLDLARGSLNTIARDPRWLLIDTPYADAGIEGTEFEVEMVDEELVVTVFEGLVVLTSETFGVRYIDAGQTIRLGAGGYSDIAEADPLQRELLWARYFEAVLDGPLPEPGAALPEPGNVNELTRQAQSELLAGRVEAARANVLAALVAAPDDPAALAVAAMIARAERDYATAQSLVDRALTADPDSTAILIAHSHLLEDLKRVDEALAAARSAAASDPASALARDRVAEALVAARAYRAARAAANEILLAEADNPVAYSILGFVALANGDTSEAIDRFEASIIRDSRSPKPRLGLAVALIRSGDEAQGRDMIERAVSLDPNNSELRNLAGAVYFDEFREEFAIPQLELGSRIDSANSSADSTLAVVRTSRNEPIEAVRAVDRARAAGTEASVFGSSSSYLDNSSVRTASYSSAYQALGLERQAQVLAYEASTDSPLEAAPHWLNADLAAARPDYDLIRVSEGRQAIVREQELTVVRVPQQATINSQFMESIGPSELARQAQRRSIARNGFSGEVSAVSGANNTGGTNLAWLGLGDTWSFGLTYGDYYSDGVRANNRMDHEVFNATFAVRPASRVTLLGEASFVRVDKGDIPLLFHPGPNFPTLRKLEDNDSLMLGSSVRLTPDSMFIGTITVDDVEASTSTAAPFFFESLVDRRTLDLQYIRDGGDWSFTTGIRASSSAVEESIETQVPVGNPPVFVDIFSNNTATDRSGTGYFYSNFAVTDTVQLTAGVAFESLVARQIDEEGANPKFGIEYRRGALLLRAAYFGTLSATQISREMLQPVLEPTGVAGFGQFTVDANGETARNYAIGADYTMGASLRFGAERVERSIDLPFFIIPAGSVDPEPGLLRGRESTDRIDLHWMPTARFSLHAGWQYEFFNYHGQLTPYQFSELKTRRIPVDASWQIGKSLSLKLSGTYIRQAGVFAPPSLTGNSVADESEFPVFDASFQFRLPQRRGTVELGVRNLLDEEFNFQDTDPENPRVFPERFAFARFTVLL